MYSEKWRFTQKNYLVHDKMIMYSKKSSTTRKNAHLLRKMLMHWKSCSVLGKYLCTQRNVPLTWKSAPVLGKLLLVLENIFPVQGKMHPCTRGKTNSISLTVINKENWTFNLATGTFIGNLDVHCTYIIYIIYCMYTCTVSA